MALFSNLFLRFRFKPDFSKTEYDNWLDFLDNGGTSEEWESLKKKNLWHFKHDCVEKLKKPEAVHFEVPAPSVPVINCTVRTIPSKLRTGIISVPISDRKIIDKEFEQINKLITHALKLAHLNKHLKIDTTSKLRTGIISVPISDRKIIDKEFEQINKLITHALKLAHLNKHLKIDTTCFLYAHNYTYYEGKPLTPSGRASKVPLTLHYAYNSHHEANPSQDFFGEVGYSQDGSIAKARLIFWRRKDGCMIHLGIVNKELVVKKVELNVNSGWKVVYKL